MNVRDRVIEKFKTEYGEAPSVIVRAPGRVNLIGEHTDYNGGFVLPMAIDRAAWIALRPTGDTLVTLHSLDFDEARSFDLADMQRDESSWIEYIKGVAWALLDADFVLTGFEGVVAGDVPVGAGLSSSAGLELATARAFATVSGLPWDGKQMALLAQRAENKWVGVNCGIMDQLISACGEDGHALLVDCRSLETRSVPLPPGTVVVVLDTATRRGLEGSAYNERRSQCEAAAKFFGVELLRDVTLEQFQAREAELDALPRRRARHVVSENDRTVRAAEALAAGDAKLLGQLINASHASLRDDFEVSSPALDAMAEIAQATPGCHGARMTGAGFGGCAMALIDEAAAAAFVKHVATAYEARMKLKPNVYVCRATAGAATE